MHLIKGSQVLINTAMLSVQRSLPSTCYRISYYYRGGTCSQTVFCLFCMKAPQEGDCKLAHIVTNCPFETEETFSFLFLRQSTHPRLPSWNFHCDKRWHCTIWTLDKWLCPAYLWSQPGVQDILKNLFTWKTDSQPVHCYNYLITFPALTYFRNSKTFMLSFMLA